MQQQNYVVPNSLISQDLRRYAWRRVARRRGAIEEWLRGQVKAFVRPDGLRSERGRNKAVANAIGRPESWVTEYINGENHANLDTSLALLAALGVSLTDLIERATLPAAIPRPEEESFAGLSPDGQKLALQHMEMLKRTFPRAAQQGSGARKSGTPHGTVRKVRGTR